MLLVAGEAGACRRPSVAVRGDRGVLVVAGVGLAVSVVLGLLLATTVIRPIRKLPRT